MKLIPTNCCALIQLSAGNDDPIDTLRQVIAGLKIEALKTWTPAEQGGQRAVFCVTTPNEVPLEAKLDALGFNPVSTFARRNGYPEGQLTMWLMHW